MTSRTGTRAGALQRKRHFIRLEAAVDGEPLTIKTRDIVGYGEHYIDVRQRNGIGWTVKINRLAVRQPGLTGLWYEHGILRTDGTIR